MRVVGTAPSAVDAVRVGRSWVGLAPFFKAVALYFAVGAHWGPDTGRGADGVGGAGGAALAKCAPVLALAAFVWLRRCTEGTEASERRRVAAALCWSATGDALLVWPQYFIAGMGAFAAAHLCYVWAAPSAAVRPLLAAALFAGTAFTVKQFHLHGVLTVLVPMYAALLATMCWRAWAPMGRDAGRRAVARAVGATLFVVSDTILGLDRFHAPVPHREMWVMSTYYLAQLGMALSVTL